MIFMNGATLGEAMGFSRARVSEIANIVFETQKGMTEISDIIDAISEKLSGKELAFALFTYGGYIQYRTLQHLATLYDMEENGQKDSISTIQ